MSCYASSGKRKHGAAIIGGSRAPSNIQPQATHAFDRYPAIPRTLQAQKETAGSCFGWFVEASVEWLLPHGLRISLFLLPSSSGFFKAPVAPRPSPPTSSSLQVFASSSPGLHVCRPQHPLFESASEEEEEDVSFACFHVGGTARRGWWLIPPSWHTVTGLRQTAALWRCRRDGLRRNKSRPQLIGNMPPGDENQKERWSDRHTCGLLGSLVGLKRQGFRDGLWLHLHGALAYLA